MSFSDSQVHRYSRQILLKALGGKGQERLLAMGARLMGEGLSVATAGAYLAAGGTPISVAHGIIRERERGFLFGASDVGQPAPAAWNQALTALNEEALSPCNVTGLIAECPAHFDGQTPWIALGRAGSQGVCVYRGAHGCRSCFERWVSSLGEPPFGIQTQALGALGALAFQRGVLGLEGDGLRAWQLFENGRMEPWEGERCPNCA